MHDASPNSAEEAAGLATSLIREVHENRSGALLHINLPLHSDSLYHGELEIVSILASDEVVDTEEALRVHDFLPGRTVIPRADDLTLRIDPLDPKVAFPTESGGLFRPALLPLVGDCVGYLQADLVERMPRLPAPHSETPLIVTPRKGGADVLSSGAKVGELWHWNWKWRPTHPKEMGSPTGVGLILDRDVADRRLHVDGMRLVHVWRARVLKREADYKEWIEETWQGSLPGPWLGSVPRSIIS